MLRNSSFYKKKIFRKARRHVRSSLTNHFVLAVQARSFLTAVIPPRVILMHTHASLSLSPSVLFCFHSTSERTNERAANSSIPPALSSVPLHATNGLWIASSFCRATSFTGEFSFYQRAASSFAHRATVKINLPGSLIAVKSERTWMTFQNLSETTAAHVILADFIDYCLFLLPIYLAFYKIGI